MMSLYDMNKNEKLELNEWQFMLGEQALSPDHFYTYTAQYGLPDKYYYYGRGGKDGTFIFLMARIRGEGARVTDGVLVVVVV